MRRQARGQTVPPRQDRLNKTAARSNAGTLPVVERSLTATFTRVNAGSEVVLAATKTRGTSHMHFPAFI